MAALYGQNSCVNDQLWQMPLHLINWFSAGSSLKHMIGDCGYVAMIMHVMPYGTSLMRLRQP